jgi:uncharacterized Zn finger protein
MSNNPMSEILKNLTLPDIRARCTDTSFERGRNYYTGGAVFKRFRHEPDRLEAYVSGTRTYRVSVSVKADGQLGTTCTCPYAYGGDCKHIVATLLAWVNEPDSFHPPIDVKAALKRRSKAQLIDLLLDIFSIYPDLVDELEVATESSDRNFPKKIAELFDKMEPWGYLTEDLIEAHLRLIARRADELAEQGKAEQARLVYYHLILGCTNMCRSFNTCDFFSSNFPYDFALGYNDLAVEQVADHGATIKAELDALYRDLQNPDALGLNEALSGVWCELMDHNLVDGQITGV